MEVAVGFLGFTWVSRFVTAFFKNPRLKTAKPGKENLRLETTKPTLRPRLKTAKPGTKTRKGNSSSPLPLPPRPKRG